MAIKPIEHFIFKGTVETLRGVKIVRKDKVIYGLDSTKSGINIEKLKDGTTVYFFPVPREFFYGADRNSLEFLCINVTKRRKVLKEKSGVDQNRPCQHIANIAPIIIKESKDKKSDKLIKHYIHFSLNDYAELCFVRSKKKLNPWTEVIAFEGNVKYTLSSKNSESIIPIYEYRREADYEWK